MRRVVVVVACVVGVLWLAPVTRTARAAPGLAPGAAAGGAAVGGRSALADFNADTYADLAVGVPFEEDRSGVVNVIYGSESGLSATDTPGQIWRQGSPGVEGTPDSGDDFGFAVAST